MPNLLSSNHPLDVAFKRFFLKFYFSFLVVQGIEARASLILGKCFAAEPHPQPLRKAVRSGIDVSGNTATDAYMQWPDVCQKKN